MAANQGTWCPTQLQAVEVAHLSQFSDQELASRMQLEEVVAFTLADSSQQFSDLELAGQMQFEEVVALTLAEGTPRHKVQSPSGGFGPGKVLISDDAHNYHCEDSWMPNLYQFESNNEAIPCETCCICMVTEIKSDNSHIVNEKCGHRFCTDCLKKYGETMVKSGKFNLPCPQFQCTELWSSQLCDHLLSIGALDQLAKRQVENVLPHWERVYCPYKDCSAIQLRPDLHSTPSEPSSSRTTAVGGVECLSCHRLFCLECQVPWHHSLSCEEYERLPEDEKSDTVFLRGIAKDRKWQRCSCGYLVERSTGCHHMRCRCGKEFCYHCGGAWSFSHLCRS